MSLLWSIVRIARVAGPSMQPTIDEGDIVLALRPWRRPRPGDVLLVRVGGRPLIKRLAHRAGSRLFLGVESPWGWASEEEVEGIVLLWARPHAFRAGLA